MVHSNAARAQIGNSPCPSLCVWEPIYPIVGSKEALCRANEIKAHLEEGINQTDRFNGPEQREGGRGCLVMNGQITEIGY